MTEMECSRKAYWVWLQQALGAGSTKVRRILSFYDTPYDFYRAGDQGWRTLGFFTARELNALGSFSLESAAAIVGESERLGQQVITLEDKKYPPILKDIHNPPCVLYVRGSLPNLELTPAIAVVGTRDATLSGRKIAFQFGCQLARAGAVVVSGGAKGIDTAAHKGALQAQGFTVCVLGCGLEYPYLMENQALREAIALHGAVVSEYPLRTPATKSSFPIRNRIISGLSVGTLVVEAAAKSGSLITADLALEQGRDVFAVPCGIDNPVSSGVNNLIKTGAKPVSCGAEVLEEYLFRFSGKIRLNREDWTVKIEEEAEKEKEPRSLLKTAFPKGAAPSFPTREPPAGISQDAALVFKALGPDPLHVTVLENQTGLPVPRLLAALTELELSGEITSHSGRRYSL